MILILLVKALPEIHEFYQLHENELIYNEKIILNELPVDNMNALNFPLNCQFSHLF